MNGNIFCLYNIQRLNDKRKLRHKMSSLLRLHNVPDDQLWEKIKDSGVRFYRTDGDGDVRLLTEAYVLERVLKERGQ